MFIRIMCYIWPSVATTKQEVNYPVEKNVSVSNVQIFSFHFLIQIHNLHCVGYYKQCPDDLKNMGELYTLYANTMLCKRLAYLKIYVFLRSLASNLSQMSHIFLSGLICSEHTEFSRGCVLCDDVIVLDG